MQDLKLQRQREKEAIARERERRGETNVSQFKDKKACVECLCACGHNLGRPEPTVWMPLTVHDTLAHAFIRFRANPVCLYGYMRC